MRHSFKHELLKVRFWPDSDRCEFNSNVSGYTCMRANLLVCISFRHAENAAGPRRQALLPVC